MTRLSSSGKSGIFKIQFDNFQQLTTFTNFGNLQFSKLVAMFDNTAIQRIKPVTSKLRRKVPKNNSKSVMVTIVAIFGYCRQASFDNLANLKSGNLHKQKVMAKTVWTKLVTLITKEWQHLVTPKLPKCSLLNIAQIFECQSLHY